MNTTQTNYEKQAADFLLTNCIAMNFSRGHKSCPWSESASGNHYRITIYRKDEYKKGVMVPDCDSNDNPQGRMSFDFWGSINDAQAGRDPSAYDVLACISSDIYCDDSFSEFCGSMGYDEDSRKALATFKRCRAFADKLNAFFTDTEKKELAEIQ